MGRRITKEDGAAYHAQRLLRFLARKGESLSPLLILPHDYPDPDALASAYALQYLAQKGFGMEAKIGYGGVISRAENRAMVRILKIPVQKMKAAQVRRYRNVALVDMSRMEKIELDISDSLIRLYLRRPSAIPLAGRLESFSLRRVDAGLKGLYV